MSVGIGKNHGDHIECQLELTLLVMVRSSGRCKCIVMMGDHTIIRCTLMYAITPIWWMV
jgi:hypothetical protein